MTNPTDKQSDIVAELREEAENGIHTVSGRKLYKRAADELERLRAALQLADHALDYYASTFSGRADLAAHNAVKRALSHSATKETTE
jgi:hypothetical protein